MAQNKKSFLLYSDLIHTFDQLTDVEAGQLIKHVLAYVNDKNPECKDKIIAIAFEPIKQQLKRDLKDWEQIREKRRLAGLASAEQKKHMLTHVNTSQQESTESTVNVTVNDNVTVNVNDKEKKRAAFRPDFLKLPDSHRDIFIKWWEYKVAIKSKYVSDGWDAFVRTVEKEYPTAAEFADAVEYTMSNNWKGLRKNETNKGRVQGSSEPATRFNRLK